MNFVRIGVDSSSDAFVEAATTAGDRWIALLDVPSEAAAPTPAGVRRLTTLEELAGVEKVDYLVLAGNPQGRAELLQYLARLDPIDLVVAVPVANRADVYYEFGLLRSETKVRVLPLMEELGCPAIERIKHLLKDPQFGAVRWLEWTRPLDGSAEGVARFLDGWSWVRDLLGEIENVNATPAGGEPPRQVVAAVRSQSGVAGSIRWVASSSPAHRLHLELEHGAVDVELPEGECGPATIRTVVGGKREETWTAASPAGRRWYELWTQLPAEEGVLWVHATRQVELADAVERSLERERAVSLTYDEFSDAAGFKSIMTATGCGLIWLVILVAILAAVGVPYIHYAVLPVLLLFLFFQLFGLVYRQPTGARPEGSAG